jgi:hypothetical protein
MGKFKDLSGKKFWRLTLIEIVKRKPTPIYLCKCDCGSIKKIDHYSIIYGKTKSCGCLKNENTAQRSTVHGLLTKENKITNKRALEIYTSMKARCYNKHKKNYMNYGGRGIKVCRRWKHSFEKFFTDMSPIPPPPFSLDRIDNNKGYSKDNCRWATIKEQRRNRRNNKIISYNGKQQCVSAWAEETGVKYTTLMRRFNRGWDHNKILTPVIHRYRRPIKRYPRSKRHGNN